MPSMKKRMSITLDDDVDKALREFSAASGTAKASFVTNILRDAVPMLQSMTKAFKLAKKQPVQALEAMNEVLLQVQISAAQGSLDLNQKTQKVKLRRMKQKP